MEQESPIDPAGVWKLVQHADDLLKYAHNRDPATAYAQAAEVLERAAAAAAALADRAAGEQLASLIAVRREDLARLSGESGSGSSEP